MDMGCEEAPLSGMMSSRCQVHIAIASLPMYGCTAICCPLPLGLAVRCAPPRCTSDSDTTISCVYAAACTTKARLKVRELHLPLQHLGAMSKRRSTVSNGFMPVSCYARLMLAERSPFGTPCHNVSPSSCCYLVVISTRHAPEVSHEVTIKHRLGKVFHPVPLLLERLLLFLLLGFLIKAVCRAENTWHVPGFKRILIAQAADEQRVNDA